MTITSKYNAKCKKCGGYIHAGQQVEWSKENGTQHLVCPDQPAFAKGKHRPPASYRPADPPIAPKPSPGFASYASDLQKIINDPKSSPWLREAARVLDFSKAIDANNDVQVLFTLQQLRIQ